jgi:3-hydroxyisobutyrate dehydrogenase
MADRPSVAVLGTGIMGGGMAGRLAGAGFPLAVWNRSRAKAEALAAAGARVADGPADAVAGADVVLTMLADGDATTAVMAEAVGAARPGTLWLQMGTVGIEATDRLAALAAGAGLGFVDAPVVGTKQPAEQGTLTVFASGPSSLRERSEEVFAPLAAKVLWVGGVGAGTRLKLVVNGWLATLLAGLAEAVALAEGLGIDPRVFLAAIEGGPLGAPYAQLKGSMMIERDYPASFPLHLLAKDVGLVAAAASAARVPLRVPSAVLDLLMAAVPTYGDQDMSAVVEAVRA